ncbi:hypothetical protein ABIB25_004226 [Nakamurella sp. UYEF19]|uniref:class F sortase n=1 Tax=Nakamurella sp. UYEF19 TaxID=1756392 RepID=UPI00339A3A93
MINEPLGQLGSHGLVVTARRGKPRVVIPGLSAVIGLVLVVGAATAYASNVPGPTDAGIVPGGIVASTPGPPTGRGTSTVSSGADGMSTASSEGGETSTAASGRSGMSAASVSPPSPSVRLSPSTRPSTAAGSVTSHAGATTSGHPVGGGRPMLLMLPSLQVSAQVQMVRNVDGVLAVPTDPSRVGWWAESAPAGSSHGSTVIDGHIDSATLGEGALFRLAELGPGDPVELRTSAGVVVRYQVQARRVYEKSRGLPAEVFDQKVASRLVLISCGGPFDSDARSYLDNIVVYATPVPG